MPRDYTGGREYLGVATFRLKAEATKIRATFRLKAEATRIRATFRLKAEATKIRATFRLKAEATWHPSWLPPSGGRSPSTRGFRRAVSPSADRAHAPWTLSHEYLLKSDWSVYNRVSATR
jgi:hypothetical protein